MTGELEASMEEVFLLYLVHLGGWAPGPRPALLLPCLIMRPNCILKGYGPSWNLLPQRGLLLGEGCLPVAKVPGFRPLAVATAMLYSLFLVPSLSLLVMPVPSHAWSRPLWYQVGLDLQPWGCQPNGLDGCRSSLGCPGYWMALGGSRIYPVAGITITTTMMLAIGHMMLQRWRSQVIKDQLPQVTPSPCRHWKRQAAVVSDRTLVLRVLHMLDAILLHIEGHLQRLASQEQIQIKGTPTQSG